MAQKIVRNTGRSDLIEIPIPGGTVDLKSGEEKVVTGEVASILTRIFSFVQSEDYLEVKLDEAVEEIQDKLEKVEEKKKSEPKPKVVKKTTKRKAR